MHCKHCGEQIEDDSKFCTNCGGKVGTNERVIQPQQFSSQVQTESVFPLSKDKIDFEKLGKGFLLIALFNFGFQFFWVTINLILNANGYEMYDKIAPITKPLGIVNSIIVLFLCFMFSKNKGHKTFFLILAGCVLVYRIYEAYLQ